MQTHDEHKLSVSPPPPPNHVTEFSHFSHAPLHLHKENSRALMSQSRSNESLGCSYLFSGADRGSRGGQWFQGKGGGGGVAWLLLLNNVQNKQKEHENNWLIQHLPRASCIVVWRLFYSSVSGQTICFIMSATLAQNSLLLEAAAKPTHHVSNQYAVRIRLLTQLFFLESSVRLNLLLFPVFPRRVSVKHDVDTMRHETSSGRIVDVWAVAYLHARYQSRNGMCHRVNNLRPVPR